MIDLRNENRQKVIITKGSIDLIVLNEQGDEIYRHLMPTQLLIKILVDRRKEREIKERSDQ